MRSYLMLFLFFTCRCWAAEDKPTNTIDSLSSESGSVIVKGYTDVGKLQGNGGGVTIDADELKDVVTDHSQYFLLARVKDSDGAGRVAKIAYEEIDPLISGIEYVEKADKTVTRMDNFEEKFRTKDGLVIVVFGDDSKEKRSASIGVENIETFMKVEKLEDFKALLLKGKASLDAAKAK